MEKLSLEAIIKNIKSQQIFHAVADDYSFTIKIDEYVPYACAAIHDGHQFRKELWENCLHTEYDRWYEEDPETKKMIISHPIVIAGCDSRFEYDLNRDQEDAVFETAWGKQLWKVPLSLEQKQKSLAKHKAFYDVVHAMIETIESKFGTAIVYDMHSYNWKRWDRDVPTWNLGTSNVDNERFGAYIESWRQSLSEINFPYNIPSTALVNNTFQGNGYFLKYITKNFTHTLVLATEISKIYCDEYKEIIYPEIVDLVANALNKKVKEHAMNFYNNQIS